MNHLKLVPRGCGHTEGRYHDCWYVERVNRLIPEASELAESRVEEALDAGEIQPIDRRRAFNRIFLEEMDAACVRAGLRQALPRGLK